MGRVGDAYRKARTASIPALSETKALEMPRSMTSTDTATNPFGPAGQLPMALAETAPPPPGH